MLSQKTSKQAFTLVELSVVIVILSIMLSTVLVSRSLIAVAKINKIQEEYNTLNNAIGAFSDFYSCLPGDCAAIQLAELTATNPSLIASGCLSASNIPNSNANAYNSLNTGGVESTFKRTCMMLELQAAGTLSALNSPATPDALNMTGSVVGVNIPYAKFSKQAAWDYRTINAATTTNVLGITIPYSVSFGSTSNNAMKLWAGKNAFVIRDSNYTTIGANTPISTIGDITSNSFPNSSTQATYAVSATLASKLDTKFDDGMPFSGNIASGRNALDSVATSAVSCHSLATAENTAGGAGIVGTVTYQQSNNINTGCLVAYLSYVAN